MDLDREALSDLPKQGHAPIPKSVPYRRLCRALWAGSAGVFLDGCGVTHCLPTAHTKEAAVQFQKSIEINAPVDRTWAVVAHDFDKVGEWSSAVASSRPNTAVATPEGATVGGRVCATPGFGDLEETFTSYSEANNDFVFEVSGMPSFIKLAQNHVTVERLGADNSQVTLDITMNTNAIGKLMGPLFAIKLKSTLKTFLGELKDYVEKGEISQKKTKMLAKAGD
jgi:Polyketide cyclase / dehydrase and lipid transport